MSIAAPVTLLSRAMIGEEPLAKAVAILMAEMVATEGFPDTQVTWLVRFSVVLSEKLPMAVNRWEVPRAMLGLVGVTVIDKGLPLGSP